MCCILRHDNISLLFHISSNPLNLEVKHLSDVSLMQQKYRMIKVGVTLAFLLKNKENNTDHYSHLSNG